MANHPHTPGPWNMDEDNLSIFADDGTAICDVMDVEDFPCVEEGTEDDVAAECRANALLITAAPDLLTMLKHAVHWHDQITPADVARYEAAIAKAEGK